MKTPAKYIMGPLLVGGFIISLCFTIYAFRKIRPMHDNEPVNKHRAASPTLKQDVSAFGIRILQKLISH
jgi:hypothetical protein